MSITRERLKSGLGEYINKEFTERLTGLKVWAFPVMAGAYIERLDTMLENNKETLQDMGYMDNEGNIDIDALYNEFITVAKEKGDVSENIPLLGIVSFSYNDINNLYNILRR